MFFVIPEMPSKTVVVVLKKIPDHFNICLHYLMHNVGQTEGGEDHIGVRQLRLIHLNLHRNPQ